MNQASQQIIKRIRGKGRGAVFTPRDFLDLGSRAAVDKALSRLVASGAIRRIGHGLYDFPRTSPQLGQLSPAPDAVAKALARRIDGRLQLPASRAANALGLTTQVPAQLVYLTDGRSRRLRLGNQLIDLRHASPRRLVGAGNITGTVLQALSFLGPHGVNDFVISKIARLLTSRDKVVLKRQAINVPDWLRPAVKRIAQSS